MRHYLTAQNDIEAMSGKRLDTNRIFHGDNLKVMRNFPDSCIDAIVTDPPYGLSFMGKEWDHAVPSVAYWQECHRIAKPGAHLLAFGGTRSHHRLMCAIEDAGWEVRDCLMWLYNNGMPKGLSADKAIDRQRYDRQEVLEVTRWIASARDAAGVKNSDIDAAFNFHGMAGHWTSQRKQPTVPTIEQVPKLLEALKHPTVPRRINHLLDTLNGRKGQPGQDWDRREKVGSAKIKRSTDRANTDIHGKSVQVVQQTKPASDLAQQWHGWNTALKPAWEPIVMTRKPLDGTLADNLRRWGVGALNVDGCRINEDASERTTGRWPANIALDESEAAMLDQQGNSNARYFYTTKATRSDRTPSNDHPTVKPTDLIRWLVRMVCPSGGTVLDPFNGSGATTYAAAVEACRYIGIEIDKHYCEIAKRRLAQGVLFQNVQHSRKEGPTSDQQRID